MDNDVVMFESCVTVCILCGIAIAGWLLWMVVEEIRLRREYKREMGKMRERR